MLADEQFWKSFENQITNHVETFGLSFCQTLLYVDTHLEFMSHNATNMGCKTLDVDERQMAAITITSKLFAKECNFPEHENIDIAKFLGKLFEDKTVLKN